MHNVFWPSSYGQVVTSADLLRLAFATVVAVGGVYELHRAAKERAMLLAEEEERLKRLVELSAMKADFTAMVAHELASPLRAVRGLAEMLALGNFCPDQRAGLLERLQVQADGLEVLIADVRASAVAEREDFATDPRPVAVGSLFGEAAAFAGALPGVRPLLLNDVDDDVEVLADPFRIGQVLRNLLSNGAKYSSANSRIWLRAVPSSCRLRVRFEVADEGPGISAEDLPRVFQKYCRGRAGASGNAGGIGLGLYLSRRIVRGHGSDLTVRTEPGGSVFCFELDLVPASGRSRERERPEEEVSAISVKAAERGKELDW